MIAQLLPWFELSLKRPRVALRSLLDLGWPPRINWLFFAAASMSAAALASLQQAVILLALGGDLGAVNFLELAARRVLLQLVLVFALTAAGRALGGSARLDQIALMQGWLQALFIVPGALLVFVVLLVPQLMLLSLLSLGLATLGYLAHGMSETNGFYGWPRGFLALILAFAGLLMLSRLFAIPLI